MSSCKPGLLNPLTLSTFEPVHFRTPVTMEFEQRRRSEAEIVAGSSAQLQGAKAFRHFLESW
jgi:hypothetical protein